MYRLSFPSCFLLISLLAGTGGIPMADAQSPVGDTAQAVWSPPIASEAPPMASEMPPMTNASPMTAGVRLAFDPTAVRPQQSTESGGRYFTSTEPAPCAAFSGFGLQASLWSDDQLKQFAMVQDPATIPVPVSPTETVARRIPQPDPLQVDPAVLPATALENLPSGQEQEPATGNAGQQEPDAGGNPTAGNRDLQALQAQVENRKQRITDNESLDATSKSDSLQQLNLASEWLQKATGFQAYLTRENAARASFDSDLEKLKEQLKPEMKVATPEISKSTQELTAELQAREAELQSKKERQREIRERMATREKRVTQLPGLRKSNQEQLRKVEASLAEIAGNAEDVSQPLSLLVLRCKQAALEYESEALQLEAFRLEQGARKLPLERDLIDREIKRLEAEIELWRKATEQKRALEIKQQKEDALKAEQALEAGNPVLRELAERNQALADERSQLTSRIDSLKRELETVKSQNLKIEENRERLVQKIDAVGLTAATGMQLVEHRRSLIPAAKSQNRLAELTGELRDLSTEVLTLKEERQTLASTDELVESKVAAAEFENMSEEDARAKVRQLAETQLQYIDDLLRDYEAYREEMSKVEVEHRTLISNIEESQTFSDDNALWVRSANPVSVQDLGHSVKGLQSFLNRDAWMQLLISISRNIASRPYETGLFMFIMGALLVFQRRLKWSHG